MGEILRPILKPEIPCLHCVFSSRDKAYALIFITFFFPLTVLKNLEPRSSVLFYEICDIVQLVYKIELMSSGKNESYRLAKHKVPCSGK